MGNLKRKAREEAEQFFIPDGFQSVMFVFSSHCTLNAWSHLEEPNKFALMMLLAGLFCWAGAMDE